jgi:hypothetical protein
LANRHRDDKVRWCRRRLLPWNMAAQYATAEPPEAVTIDPAALPRCPQCGGCRLLRYALPKQGGVCDGDTS